MRRPPRPGRIGDVDGEHQGPAARLLDLARGASRPCAPPGQEHDLGASPANLRAAARPMPPEAPVITTTPSRATLLVPHSDDWKEPQPGALYPAAPRVNRPAQGIQTVSAPNSFPPIGEYALISDCHAAALVSLTGSIDWCCLPRFDSGSAFARVLDRERGGRCSIVPAGRGRWEYRREYLKDTLVLATTLEGPAGEARILDCLTTGKRARDTQARTLVRVIEGLPGR